MPSFQWIKLYHEILADPKMGRLPDHLWRRCIECFLMAGQRDEGGFLPPVDDMAWMLRADADQLTGDMQALAAVGVLELRDERWFVVHFAERQAHISGADRVAQHRERQRKREYYEPETIEQQPCNEPVTERYTDKIREDTDKNRVEIEKTEFVSADDDASPPAGSADADEIPGPVTFQDWQSILQQAEPKNRIVLLRDMFIALYPNHDPPDYGYIGRAAKAMTGTGRLAELLWQHSTRPPSGDVLAYLMRVANNNGSGRRKERPVADGSDYLKGSKYADLIKH